MTYPTLTVCLDEGRACARRLRFALDFALRHDAWLQGVHLSYMPSPALAAYDGAEALFSGLERDLEARQAAARQAFLAAAEQAGVPASFVAASSLDSGTVVAHARASDLLIAGQPDAADSAAYVGAGYPARLVLDAGRPVLFLPHDALLPTDFRHVLVAWNGSRESSRALFDALPLLRLAERVTVLTASRDGPPPVAPAPAPDLGAVLARHGIRAQVRVDTTRADPGEWLLERAADREDPADLVVAGAYGHSRFAELVLGGVTRSLLERMTLPVLFSH